MRRKNGYTLTEILVVILLLAVVGGIIIFNVNSILNKNKQKSYERFITNVKSSAETYASLNLDKVSDLYSNKSFTYITVGELIDQGFLDEKTTNPYTNTRIGRDELIKLSLSTETGDLSITYPATEDNKEVFLSAVVLSTTVETEVDCMSGIGTYTLALSDEKGQLILDKDALINEYKLTCKLPDSFNKRSGDMNNELGSTNQIGTYEIEYYWLSKSGTRGTGKRYLKVVPNTITITYNVDLIEGEEWTVDPWTNATCKGKITNNQCTKEVLVGYNYNTLSTPHRDGYEFAGWYTEQQKDAEKPYEPGLEITSNNKVVEKTDHTIYAHWKRREFTIPLDSTLNGRPAVKPGTTEVYPKFNLPIGEIVKPERYYDVSFNLNDSRNSNGTTEGTSSSSKLTATWDFQGYWTIPKGKTDKKYYIDSEGHGNVPWTELEDVTLYATWTNGLITLPSASRPGYQFVGWFTDPTNGTMKTNADTYEETTELFAHWNAIDYKISLDYNTDDGGSTHENENIPSFMQKFDDNFDNLFYPTRNGYNFEGWYTPEPQHARIFKETRATNDYSIIDNNGLTLRAEWSKKTYDVKLNLNPQGDMSHIPYMKDDKPTELTMEFDTDTNQEVGVPVVPGWTFLGWYTDDNVKVYNADGKHNTDITTFFNKQNNWIYLSGIDLYAKWEQNNYSLTIDLNKQSKMSFNPVLSDGTTKYEYVMTYDSTSNNEIPYGVLAGWKFLGWFDSDEDMVYDQTGKFIESSSKDYFRASKWNHEGDVALHARWEQLPISVRLNLENPSESDSTSIDQTNYTFIYDDEITENVSVPVHVDGFEFLGWFDGDTKVFNADGSINSSETNYFNGKKWINATSSIVLNSRWKANGYVVSLKQPDATKKGTELININYNAKLPNIQVPERKYSVEYYVNDSEGSTRSTEVQNITKQWTFDGYFTDTDNQYYNGSGETTIVYREPRNIDLYARWSNGTLENMPQPTRTGYNFDGWYLDNGTFNNKVENGYTVTEDIKLYAHWIAQTHQIKLDNNKASVPGDSVIDVTFDQNVKNTQVPVKIYVVTLDKNYETSNKQESRTATWTFQGYYTQPDGQGERYYDAAGHANKTYLLESDLQLYAYYEGGTITLPTYSREDYQFKGWYDGSRKATATDTYEENKTLLAHWQSDTYNLSLEIGNPSNMTGTPTLGTDSYMMAMHTNDNNTINVPSAVTGWEFLGWYDGTNQVFDKNGKWNSSASAFFDSEGNWIKRDNVTLYGNWSEKSYPLTIDSVDPTTGSGTVNIPLTSYQLVYDRVGINSVSIPDYVEGYSFDGYYLGSEMIFDASGNRVNNNSVFAANGKVRKASATTLAARWSKHDNVLQLIVKMDSRMKDIPRLAKSIYEMEENSANNNVVNIPSNITGWEFKGWYDGDEQVFDETGTHVTSSYFDASGKWLKTTGVRLTSKYEPVISRIRLQEDSNTVVISNTYTAIYGNPDPTSVAVPNERAEYEFKGWYYGDIQVYDGLGNKNSKATQFFDSNGDWAYVNDVTLTAKWEPLDIKVNLDLNNSGLPFTPQVNTFIYTMELNSDHNKHINIPTNIDPGYSFQGWYDGDTKVYDENGNYDPTASSYFTPEGKWIRRSSVTLKAKWIKI